VKNVPILSAVDLVTKFYLCTDARKSICMYVRWRSDSTLKRILNAFSRQVPLKVGLKVIRLMLLFRLYFTYTFLCFEFLTSKLLLLFFQIKFCNLYTPKKTNIQVGPCLCERVQYLSQISVNTAFNPVLLYKWLC
jgi:hypothetical protein